MRPWTGFTLIEALIAMLLVALLLGVAVPAWTSASAATRSAAARAALEGTLIRGMRHATITDAPVVVCPAATLGCRDTMDWSGGWIAWADLDRDRRRDPNETLLQRARPLASGVRLRSTTGRRRLVLRPHGGAAAGSNVTFTLCDARGADSATSLVMANSGQLRAGKPSRAAALACVSGR